jgi:hypothetical protein
VKKLLLLIILGYAFKSYSQDTAKIKQIDSLVNVINNNYNLKTHTDSITNDVPAIGFLMKTYLTVVTDTGQLKKYVNYSLGTQNVNNISKRTTTSSSFYFDKNKLIKVVEFIIEDGKENHADWYFADDKPLYYTVKNDRSEERAILLLDMSKNMLKLIHP